MTVTTTNTLKAAALVVLSLAIAAMGIYVAEVDDAPGAAVMALGFMIIGVVLGVKAARHRLPAWAVRAALAVAVVIAAFAAFLTRTVTTQSPPDVPSTIHSAPSPEYAAPVERAREFVRAAILEQNLPGVSVAVGTRGTMVWAEGFGWRDVGTRTPVTPNTRFNIGTAASALTSFALAPLGLRNTGTDTAAEWSPEHIGEPGEDFPPLTIIRHNILQPLGIAPSEYPLPDERATFYVPQSDDDPRRGRRLMYMRDLACCAGTMAFYSTAPDLVRVGLAHDVSANGELAGGLVMSLLTRRDSGISVAVLSNIAHADTPALSLRIADAFATAAR